MDDINFTVGLLEILFFLGVMTAITSSFFIKNGRDWWGNFLQGFSTEMFGAIVTAILFGFILVAYQDHKDVEQYKDDLLLQMGSPNNAFAVEAVRILRHKGWLDDPIFVGVDLSEANLQGAKLYGANLQGANLQGANLQGANLIQANLQNADLRRANLQNAFLYVADLQYAALGAANLHNAHLTFANLDYVNFQLENTTTNGVTFTPAVMPNSINWYQGMDIGMFTNLDNPNYYNPHNQP